MILRMAWPLRVRF